MRYGVEESYDHFVEIVSEGRNLPKEKVDQIGQGRVWSGINALDLGLINKYGGIKDAINIAASMAGLENYRIKSLPEQENPIEAFLEGLSSQASAKVLSGDFKDIYNHYSRLKELINEGQIQARLPFDIKIY